MPPRNSQNQKKKRKKRMMNVIFLSFVVSSSLVSAFIAAPSPQLRRKIKSNALIPSSSIWLAETGAASSDPTMVGLALGSFGLLLFISVGTIYLTASDRLEQSKLENPQPEKKRLPTMAELETKGIPTNAENTPEGPNRQARRIEQRSKGKKNISDRITF
uniref:Transmembrane protein n=1 Tax=Aureoumbra lagunensis TaxID=44058 RepID=A0A6S8CRB2_9STRA|mmetsp:Transcript_4264/g.6486  ORF Transcript_4264/g.6486 Transcript_4264/m.6486 type:complete len:160 (-) Transcript_4264:238-717(-)